jgi:hypothetical protein
MNKGRVGEERKGKETDGCPLTIALHIDFPLLGIVSDLLHFYIFVLLITFSYAMCLRKY